MLKKKKQLKKYFTPKLILIYVFTIIFSLLKFNSFNNSLAISYIFALFCLQIPTIIPICITLITTFIVYGINQTLFSFLSIVIFILSFFIFKPKLEKNKLNLSLNVIVTLTVIELFNLIKYKNAINIYELISQILFIYIFYIILINSIDYLYKKTKFSIITREEIIAISIIIFVASLIFNFNIFGINLLSFILILIIGFVSYKYGIISGVLTTIYLSLICVMFNILELQDIMQLVIYSAVLGLLSHANKRYLAITIVLCLAVYIYIYGNLFISIEFIEKILVMLVLLIFSRTNPAFLNINKVLLLPEITTRKFKVTDQEQRKKQRQEIKNYKMFKLEVLNQYKYVKNNKIAKKIIEDNLILKQIFIYLKIHGKINYTYLNKLISKRGKIIIATQEEKDLIIKPELNGLIQNINLIFENLNKTFGYKVKQRKTENKLEKNSNMVIEISISKYLSDVGIINNNIDENLHLIGYIENLGNEITQNKAKIELAKLCNEFRTKNETFDSNVDEIINNIVKLNNNISFQLLVFDEKTNCYSYYRYNSPRLYMKTKNAIKSLKGKETNTYFKKTDIIENGTQVVLVNNNLINSSIQYSNKDLYCKYFLRDNNLKTKDLAKALLKNSQELITANINKSLIVIAFENTKEEN